MPLLPKGDVADLRERIQRALAEGSLPPVDGHAAAGIAVTAERCAVCGRTVERGEYVFEITPSLSAHRDCFFAWHIESEPYFKDKPSA
jgi:hypothetical protein